MQPYQLSTAQIEYLCYCEAQSYRTVPPIAMPHLYEAVAAEIEHRIENGSYHAGDRLPAVRRLSTQFQVSISTAVEAWKFARARAITCVPPKPTPGANRRFCDRLPSHRP